MNLLDLVPSFSRQLGTYQKSSDTDSQLAAYLADAIEALSSRWVRTYAITYTAPYTYEVSPDVAVTDKRIIILAASIIYKGANVTFASIRDGDFAYDPQQGRQNPLQVDILELEKLLPSVRKLAGAVARPLMGYSSIWSPESYLFKYMI